MTFSHGNPSRKWMRRWPTSRAFDRVQTRLPLNPHIQGYASRTGTRTTLAALRASRWRLLVSATGVWRTEGFAYALDNGAWTAFQKGIPFDEDKFRGVVQALGAGADWIVAPDIVGGGFASLTFSESWLPELLTPAHRQILIAVQDGLQPADLRALLLSDTRIGIFLGGTTEYKLREMRRWGEFCQEWGRLYHVGRVNTPRRIRLARLARAHSFDGTGPILFPKTLPELNRARSEYIACLAL